MNTLACTKFQARCQGLEQMLTTIGNWTDVDVCYEVDPDFGNLIPVGIKVGNGPWDDVGDMLGKVGAAALGARMSEELLEIEIGERELDQQLVEVL